MRTLCVTNQKGGVGKTTVAVHLAYRARERGLRVLLVDFDRQASLTGSVADATLLAADREHPAAGAHHLFAPLDRPVLPHRIDAQWDLYPASPALGNLSEDHPGLLRAPRGHLARRAPHHDLCIIDTPGALGFHPPMTIAALIAADAVVCPFSVGFYEATALQELWAYLLRIKRQGYQPDLRLLGLLPSRINTRSREERNGLEHLRAHLDPIILPDLLPERAAVKQAIMRRVPVWQSPRGSSHRKAALEWRCAMDRLLNELVGPAEADV